MRILYNRSEYPEHWVEKANTLPSNADPNIPLQLLLDLYLDPIIAPVVVLKAIK